MTAATESPHHDPTTRGTQEAIAEVCGPGLTLGPHIPGEVERVDRRPTRP